MSTVGATSAGTTATSGSSAASAPPAGPVPRALTQDGPDVTNVPGASGTVALTFHGAGDVALTAAALRIAAAAGAHLTVFAVGQWLAATPALGRDLLAAGHDLGNHTWSHQTMPSLTPAQAAVEIREGAAAVARSVGSAGLLFRPSGTPTSTSTIRAAALASGYHRCISYDVDPRDYQDPGRDAVVTRTLAHVKGGSIVSLHLGHQGTIDALPGILAGLASRSLRAVRLTDLLQGLAS